MKFVKTGLPNSKATAFSVLAIWINKRLIQLRTKEKPLTMGNKTSNLDFAVTGFAVTGFAVAGVCRWSLLLEFAAGVCRWSLLLPKS